MIKVAIFDIDNTLTESRSVISPETARLLSRLIDTMPVALISGGSLQSFDHQVISHLSHTKKENLYALPTSGAELQIYERGEWRKVYSFPISHDKKRALFKELSKTLGISPVELGTYIEDRGSQITYAALGINAPLDLKYAWDPTREKRKAIIQTIKPHLHGLSMTIGGSTSIDFTEEGVDKAFGVSKLLKHLGVAPSEAAFVGDALDTGGNDAPVKTLGVLTLATKEVAQTRELISELIGPAQHAVSRTKETVAFFCAEYALGNDEKAYAGGLGVLAADLVYQAGEDNLPFVALGMRYADTSPEKQGFALIPGLEIAVPIEGKNIFVRVWERRFGTEKKTALYLVDPDLQRNSPDDRIAGHLYDTNHQTHLRQQMLIGIGGFRLLKALGIEPRVYHINEGNMAFAAMALLAEGFASARLSGSALVDAVRTKLVSTKHTILPAGAHISPDDLWRLVGGYCESYGIDKQFLISLGAQEREQGMFSSTRFLLHLSGKSNAVSLIHALFEKKKHADSPLMAITNGVYQKRWQSPLWKKSAVSGVLSDAALWKTKNALRKELIDLVSKRSGVTLSPDRCTVVWTRRFVPYKRPFTIFEDPKRLKALLSDPKNPIQIIISGKVYSADPESKAIEEKVKTMIAEGGYDGRVVYMPGYSIESAQKLVAGADIWLNTPIRGKEACGTSGMKAALNGGLQMSVSDGWVDEVNWKGVGWVLPDENISDALYGLLEGEAARTFSKRSEDGLPLSWIEMMRSTMNIVESRYTTAQALKAYYDKLYCLR